MVTIACFSASAILAAFGVGAIIQVKQYIVAIAIFSLSLCLIYVGLKHHVDVKFARIKFSKFIGRKDVRTQSLEVNRG